MSKAKTGKVTERSLPRKSNAANSKSNPNSSNKIWLLHPLYNFIRYSILLPFILLSFIYGILFQLPNQPSIVLGFFRLLFWGSIFWFPDHEQLFNHYFASYSDTIRLAYPVYSALTFVMALISLGVMLGFNKNINVPIQDDLPGFEGRPNTSFTMRQIEWRVSNRNEREKLMKKLFGD